jgi:hypothetical protein
MSTMALGAYLGILIQVRYFCTLDWPEMMGTNIWKSLLRLLVSVLILAPFGLMFVFIPNQNINIAIMIIFKTTFPLLAMFVVLFGFGNYIFVRLNLVSDSYAAYIPIDERLRQLKLEQEPYKDL